MDVTGENTESSDSPLAVFREFFLTIHFTPGFSLCMFACCWAVLGVVRLGAQN